jgi:hypothetical protein
VTLPRHSRPPSHAASTAFDACCSGDGDDGGAAAAGESGDALTRAAESLASQPEAKAGVQRLVRLGESGGDDGHTSASDDGDGDGGEAQAGMTVHVGWDALSDLVSCSSEGITLKP